MFSLYVYVYLSIIYILRSGQLVQWMYVVIVPQHYINIETGTYWDLLRSVLRGHRSVSTRYRLYAYIKHINIIRIYFSKSSDLINIQSMFKANKYIVSRSTVVKFRAIQCTWFEYFLFENALFNVNHCAGKNFWLFKIAVEFKV